MITIDEQLEFMREYVIQIAMCDARPGSRFLKQANAVVESLNKLKAQEDLIDQQADECAGLSASSVLQLILNDTDASHEVKKSNPINQLLEAQSRDIAEIKETIHAIANKLGLAVITEYHDKNTVKTTTITDHGKIEETKQYDAGTIQGGIDFGDPKGDRTIESLVKDGKVIAAREVERIDPAVKLLIGDDAEIMQYEDLAKVNSDLDHDIAILIYIRGQRMTSKELSETLAEMVYQTADLDLLKSAKAYVTSQLPL